MQFFQDLKAAYNASFECEGILASFSIIVILAILLILGIAFVNLTFSWAILRLVLVLIPFTLLPLIPYYLTKDK